MKTQLKQHSDDINANARTINETKQSFSLVVDPTNPFRRLVFTAQPGKSGLDQWGYILQQGRGWVAIYSGQHISNEFPTMEAAAQHLYDVLQSTPGLEEYLQSIVYANLYGLEPLDPPPSLGKTICLVAEGRQPVSEVSVNTQE